MVVATAEPRILMLRRIRPADFWQSVTGSLHRGEDVWTAALRELAEETGISPDRARLTDHNLTRQFRIHPAWVSRFPAGTRFNTEHLLSYRLEEPIEIRIDTREHRDWRWTEPGEALELASSWTDRAAIRSLFGSGGGESEHG